MPSRTEITTFDDGPPPPGASPWVAGAGPQPDVELVDPDPAWPARFAEVAEQVRAALGQGALAVEHVGSTSVAGLLAKPIIDVDLTVVDPDDEPAYVPALETVGFVLRVREPWWYGHRLLVLPRPRTNLHVFGVDSPEGVRHRLFRDWLRDDDADRARYAATKLDAAAVSRAAGEHSMQYNARKQQVVREIYARAFRASGLLD